MRNVKARKEGLLDPSQTHGLLGLVHSRVLKPRFLLLSSHVSVNSKHPGIYLSCVLFGFLVECLGVIWVCFWLGNSEVCIVKDEE